METWLAQRRDISTLIGYLLSASDSPSCNPIIVASLVAQPASSVTELVADLAYSVRLRQKSPTLMQLSLLPAPSSAHDELSPARRQQQELLASLDEEAFVGLVLAVTTYMSEPDTTMSAVEGTPVQVPTPWPFPSALSPLALPDSGWSPPLPTDQHAAAGAGEAEADCTSEISLLSDRPSITSIHGEIYFADHYGEPIIVKALRLSSSMRVASILNKYLTALPVLNHPNIMPYTGMYASDQLVGVARPWYADEVLSHLQRDPAKDYLPILYQVADALAAMHEADIVHSGVKPSNVLISPTGDALLCDAGMREAVQRLHAHTVPSPNDLRYMAPELFRKDAIGTKSSDVYAFSMLAAQLASRHLSAPHEQHTEFVDVLTSVLANERPTFRSEYKSLNALIEEAWDVNPRLRPSMSCIRDAIGRALERRGTPCRSCGSAHAAMLSHSASAGAAIGVPQKKHPSSVLSSPPSSPPQNTLGLFSVDA